MDSKLGNVIKEKLGIPCIFSAGVMELARGIRNQLVGLIRYNCDTPPCHTTLPHHPVAVACRSKH